MRHPGRFRLVAIIVTATTMFALPMSNAQEESESIAAANIRFYAALNELFEGRTGPMEQVWSHADDVTYMGPTGGLEVGWEQVLANWNRKASQRLGGEVRAEQVQIHAGRDIAVSCCYEVGANIVNGRSQRVSIRATNVFRKENGEWKMIGHHTDILPFLKK